MLIIKISNKLNYSTKFIKLIQFIISSTYIVQCIQYDTGGAFNAQIFEDNLHALIRRGEPAVLYRVRCVHRSLKQPPPTFHYGSDLTLYSYLRSFATLRGLDERNIHFK